MQWKYESKNTKRVNINSPLFDFLDASVKAFGKVQNGVIDLPQLVAVHDTFLAVGSEQEINISLQFRMDLHFYSIEIFSPN